MNVVEHLDNERIEKISKINEEYAKKIAYAKLFGFDFLIYKNIHINDKKVRLGTSASITDLKNFYDNFKHRLVDIDIWDGDTYKKTGSPFLLSVDILEKIKVSMACVIDKTEYRIEFSIEPSEYSEVFTLAMVESDENRMLPKDAPKKYTKIITMNYNIKMSSIEYQGPYKVMYVEEGSAETISNELIHMLIYGKPNSVTISRYI